MNKSNISDEKLQRIIELCDPDQVKKRFSTGGRCGNEGLFRFCQYIKQEKFPTYGPALPYIRKWFDRWHDKLIDETGYRLSFDDVEVMVDDLWDKIKHPIGGELAAAKSSAKRRYDETIPELDGYGGEPARKLALVCYELHRFTKKDEPFYLSSYDAAEIMGLDREKGQKRAYLTLKVFIRKGILVVDELGNKRRATRYRYMGSSPTKL